jgi:prolyl 4-hydroxylase
MIEEYSNFCEVELCEKFISLANSKFKPAATLGKNIDGYRVADGCWLKSDEDEYVSKYIKMVSSLVGIPIINMENIHIVKYEVGGQYKDHHDFLHPGESYYEEQMKRGGQRTHTVLLYLNDNFSGGETNFPSIGKKIKPETAKIVVWSNLNDDGTLDYDSIHAGLPVISGTKYIATIWIRQYEFI